MRSVRAPPMRSVVAAKVTINTNVFMVSAVYPESYGPFPRAYEPSRFAAGGAAIRPYVAFLADGTPQGVWFA